MHPAVPPPLVGALPAPRFVRESWVEEVGVREVQEETKEVEQSSAKKHFKYDLQEQFEMSCLCEKARAAGRRQREQEEEELLQRHAQGEYETEGGIEKTRGRQLGRERQKGQGQERRSTAPPIITAAAAAQQESTRLTIHDLHPGKLTQHNTIHHSAVTALIRHFTTISMTRNCDTAGAHVRVQVRAWNEVGVSEWTPAILIEIPSRVPLKPLNLVMQASFVCDLWSCTIYVFVSAPIAHGRDAGNQSAPSAQADTETHSSRTLGPPRIAPWRANRLL
jgi:hypothetical protein